MTEEQLVLAVPSKGRLEEETRRVFGESRLPIARPGGARSYVGSIKNQPQVSVRFYPAAEIARELIMGAIDIGVTGSDLIHEAAENGSQNVLFVKPLEFVPSLFGLADGLVLRQPEAMDSSRCSLLAAHSPPLKLPEMDRPCCRERLTYDFKTLRPQVPGRAAGDWLGARKNPPVVRMTTGGLRDHLRISSD